MNLSFRSHLKCGVALTAAMSLFGAASSAQAQETNWSGLYTGVAIGLGQLNATNDIQELCSYDGYDCPKQEMNAHGTAVSLYTGFMMPASPMFAWGVEGDLNWLGARGEESRGYVDSGYDATTQNKLEFLGTLRMRAGITASNTLIYLTGGLAVGVVNNSWTFVNYDSRFSHNVTRVGWVVGTGVEHYLTDRVALRLEGLYGDLGKNSATETTLSGSTYTHYPVDTRMRTRDTFGIVRAGVSIKW